MKKIIAIILVLISVNSYSQILYLNYSAKKDTALWRITGANISNKNTGNVGIGTTTPLQKLQVVDATNSNQYSGIVSAMSNNLASGVGIGYSGIAQVGSNASGELAINGKGTGNVILQNVATGNVGIGNTAPLSKLDVNGSGWFGVQKSTTDASQSFGANILNATSPTKITTSAITTPETALRLFRAGIATFKYNPSADFSIGTYATGLAALTKLCIKLGNGNVQVPDVDVMTFQGNGNVGIGTTAPTAKLEINNVTAGSGLKFTQLNAATAPTAGAAPLGVDATGNVVTTPGSIFISVNGVGGQVIGAGFTTVSMPNIVTVTGVPASNYSTATSQFTVPVTGVYEITATIRYQDGQPAGNQFGVGVHTANSDGAWFLWHAIQTTTTPARRTSFPYIRVERFTAGQTLRMISYVDGIPMPIEAAGMQIRFLF